MAVFALNFGKVWFASNLDLASGLVVLSEQIGRTGLVDTC